MQNYKKYAIPPAQLIIADVPYNVGKNFYGSNPMWYNGGDNKNGESKYAKKTFFNSDGYFKIAEYMHFCSRLQKPDDGSCRWNELSDESTEDCYWFLVNEGLISRPEQPKINFVKVERNDEVEPTNDAVQHPSHYTHGGIECIEAIKASMTADGFCDYCKGNIIKYIWRWRDKGGVEDLRKASVYLDWLINAADENEKKGENGK